jgi:hypothetical protein
MVRGNGECWKLDRPANIGGPFEFEQWQIAP